MVVAGGRRGRELVTAEGVLQVEECDSQRYREERDGGGRVGV